MKECHTPEDMSSFFDQRAGGYDGHMYQSPMDAQVYYQKLAEPITPTKEHLEKSDIGCGNELGIAPIVSAAPNAHLTCIDLSLEMLSLLKKNLQGNYSLLFRHPILDLTSAESVLISPFPA